MWSAPILIRWKINYYISHSFIHSFFNRSFLQSEHGFEWPFQSSLKKMIEIQFYTIVLIKSIAQNEQWTNRREKNRSNRNNKFSTKMQWFRKVIKINLIILCNQFSLLILIQYETNEFQIWLKYHEKLNWLINNNKSIAHK